MFTQLPPVSEDAIESLFARLAADPRPNKLDLGIGIYRNEEGQIPLMDCVRKAEQRLLSNQSHKGYLTPLGNQTYCRLVSELVLGKDHPVLDNNLLRSAQSVGAGGSLRVAAELIRHISPDSRIWFSEPVWQHQVDFFRAAGLQTCSYRYYDVLTSELQPKAMLEDLSQMRANDVLVLHGSCHNPTGEDPNPARWQQLVELVNRTGAIPLVDVAYQGFGEGIEEDVAGLRLMAAQVPAMMLAVSSSKSFGIYRDRAGLFSIINHDRNTDWDRWHALLRDTIRQLYFMPPDHGAALIVDILAEPELRESWQHEINQLRDRIHSLRHMFRRALENAMPGFDASFVERQKGMFSCLPITPAMQKRMEDDDAIYMLPNARLNFAALAQSQAERVASALARVRES